MKKLNFHRIGLVLMMMAFGASIGDKLLAQCVDLDPGIAWANDTLQCVGEETTIALSGHMGPITWLYKVESGVWLPLIGETDTILTVFPTEKISYANVVTDGVACSDTSNIITISVSSFSAVPIPGFGDATLCNLNAKPSAVPEGTGTYTEYWTKTHGTGNVIFYPDSSKAALDSAVVDAYGTYGFAWNISDGVCTKDSIVEFAFNTPPIANAGIDTNWCSTTFQMNASLNYENSSGTWSKLTTSTFNFLDDTDPTTTVNANPNNAHILIWEETSEQGCTDVDTVIIGVATMPPADAGEGGNICEKEFQLNATASIYPGKFWSLFEGPDTVIFSATNSNTSTVAAATYGENYILQWNVVNSFCVATDTIMINFYEQPVANALEPDDECGRNISLNAFRSTSSATVSRLWKYVNGSGPHDLELFQTDDTSASVTIADNAYGAYSFRWIETNGTCADSQDVGLTFYEIPNPNAGEDIDSCGKEIQLNASTSVSGSLFNWKILKNSDDIAIIGDTLTSSVIYSSAFGTYPLVLEEVNAICTASDTLQATFIEIPVADAGIGGDTCSFKYLLNAIPSLENSTTQWSMIAGNDTNAISSRPIFETSVDDPGEYIYLWEETNQTCSSEDTVRVNYHLPPSATVISVEDACGITQEISTQFNEGAQNTWTVTSGPGIARFTDQKADGSFEVVVSSAGQYVFNWNTATDYCSSDTTISIEFFDEVTANAGDDTLVCGDSLLLFPEPHLGTGLWSQKCNAVTFVNDTATSTCAMVNEYGVYSIYWTVTNGTCVETDSILIDFVQPPDAFAGKNDTICTNEYILSASPDKGYWTFYNNSTDIQISDTTDANAEILVSQDGIYQLSWTVSNKSCTDTSIVTLNFTIIHEAYAGPDQDLDNIFTTAMEAEEPGEELSGIWNLVSGSGDPVINTSATTNIRNLELGENIFAWTTSNGLCTSSDTVSIFVYDIFIPQVITPNGDGQNDVFYISGIEDVSPVEVTIMSRWGIEVFFSQDYQNDWGGTNKNGNLLTNDTYFYVINIPGKGIRKGFVILKN